MESSQENWKTAGQQHSLRPGLSEILGIFDTELMCARRRLVCKQRAAERPRDCSKGVTTTTVQYQETQRSHPEQRIKATNKVCRS